MMASAGTPDQAPLQGNELAHEDLSVAEPGQPTQDLRTQVEAGVPGVGRVGVKTQDPRMIAVLLFALIVAVAGAAAWEADYLISRHASGAIVGVCDIAVPLVVVIAGFMSVRSVTNKGQKSPH